MIIDTHCHYNVEPLLSNISQEWQDSLDRKVIGGICIGSDLSNSQIALELSKKFPTMFASIALHPEEYIEKTKILMADENYSNKTLQKIIKQDSARFEQLLFDTLSQDNNKLVAIGEIGLDYYRLRKKGLKREIAVQLQKEMFKKQLILAFQHSLPVILHVRDQIDRTEHNAYWDTFEIVSQLRNKYLDLDKKVPPIILHCASGPIDYIKKFLEIGAYIGFAGNVTYSNAPDLREILEVTPPEKILLETDAPYLAPLDKKNEVCHPHYITQTAEFLQNNYHINLDIILANTIKVFPQLKKLVQKSNKN